MRNTVVLIGWLMAHLAFAQEKLPWSATRKLTVSDFRGQPPTNQHQSLMGRTGIEMNLSTRENEELTHFNDRVTNYFYPSESWILTTDPSRLRYIQTMFDLNECMARELRKRLNATPEKIHNGEYQKIYEEVSREFQEWEQHYNNDTNYGDDPAGQMNWEQRISQRLHDLSSFCQECDSKRGGH